MWHRCKDEDECKKLFRRLALMIHPDKGGEADIFVVLQESYDMEIKLRKSKTYRPPQYKPEETLYRQRYEHIYREDKGLNILTDIEEYAFKNCKFNTDFLFSMMEFLDKNGYLTCNQYNTLVKIYYAFNMQK